MRYLNDFDLIVRDRFATLSENLFMERDRLANVCQRLVSGFSLAHTPGETRHFGNHISIFAGK
jgi:hypothetical protein